MNFVRKSFLLAIMLIFCLRVLAAENNGGKKYAVIYADVKTETGMVRYFSPILHVEGMDTGCVLETAREDFKLATGVEKTESFVMEFADSMEEANKLVTASLKPASGQSAWFKIKGECRQ